MDQLGAGQVMRRGQQSDQPLGHLSILAVDGLVHVSAELSYNRVNHPSEVLLRRPGGFDVAVPQR